MRMAARHPERDTLARFLNYLRQQGVEAELRPCDSAWCLWVYEEDARRAAGREFEIFLKNPADTRYTVAAAPPPRRENRPRTRKRTGLPRGRTPVMSALLIVSIAVTLPIVLRLPLANPLIYGLRADERLARQWWRLFTPAFMHFTWLHIVFNMLWLRELGGLLERVKGSLFMLLFFLVSAGVSNFAQYLAGGGPLFGGMSGVVYALFGYVWIKARMFPEEGFMIGSATVTMLMLWFVLGWTGAVGPIANWAHGFGLAAGIAMALAPFPSRR